MVKERAAAVLAHLRHIAQTNRLLVRLGKWEYTWLCLLVLITLAGHFTLINQPNQLMFDEQYYVPDARAILSSHETLRLEHPPLGKLFVRVESRGAIRCGVLD